MSRYIPEDIVRDIRDKSDIYEIISSYIALKKNGNRWKALCPFHEEKTPSFVVSPERQTYYCFGCGKGGNVFTFIRDKENLDFIDTVHFLASKCGVIIPETFDPQQSPQDTKKQNLRNQLFLLHNKITEVYSQYLFSTEGRIGLDYLLSRGLTEEIILKFKLGFAPESWDFAINKAKKTGFDEEVLIASGLAVSKTDTNRIYDRFRNRIMFPIWNEHGKIIAFSGRTIDADPKGGKYVNSPETPIFKKGNILYALSLSREGIKKHGFAVLCEGQIDAIAMHRAGYNNTVAPQGTAFTDEQAKLLKRFTGKVYICFDGDTAGINATYKALEILLSNNFEVKIVNLPNGTDPDTILKSSGKDALVELIHKAEDLLDYLFVALRRKYDLGSPFGINGFVQEILAIISKINNNLVRTSYASILSSRLKLPEKTILIELASISGNSQYKVKKFGSQKSNATVQRQIVVKDPIIARAEETLLEIVILHADVGRKLEEDLPHEMISNSLIGQSLNFAISITLNGEWNNLMSELNLRMEANPDAELSRVLSMPTAYTKNYDYMNAVDGCVKTIKLNNLEKEISKLMLLIKDVLDVNEKREMMRNITSIRTEILKIKKN